MRYPTLVPILMPQLPTTFRSDKTIGTKGELNITAEDVEDVLETTEQQQVTMSCEMVEGRAQ